MWQSNVQKGMMHTTRGLHPSMEERVDPSRSEIESDADIDTCQSRRDPEDVDGDSSSYASAEADGDIDLEASGSCFETDGPSLAQGFDTRSGVDSASAVDLKGDATSSTSIGTTPFNPNALPFVEGLHTDGEISIENVTGNSSFGGNETSESPDASSDSFVSTSSDAAKPTGSSASDSASGLHVAAVVDGAAYPDLNQCDGGYGRNEDGDGVQQRTEDGGQGDFNSQGTGAAGENSGFAGPGGEAVPHEPHCLDAKGFDEGCRAAKSMSRPLSALAEPWYPRNYSPLPGFHLQRL